MKLIQHNKFNSRYLLTVILLLVSMTPATFGCPYSVRQVGFVIIEQKPYRIYYFVKEDTPKKEQLKTLIEKNQILLEDSNVKVEVVNIDVQSDQSSIAYLHSLKVKKFPAAILVSPHDKAMLLPTAHNPLSEDSVRFTLESVVSSPKREELKKHIVENWCVAMLVEGDNAIENKRAKKAVNAAIEEVTGSMTDMGMIIESSPYLLVVPSEAVEEKIFLWSLGIPDEPTRKSYTRVVVLFGRGRQIGPIFEGKEITKESVVNIFYAVGKNCGCSTDHKWISGPMIPLRWESNLQDKVKKTIGIDPDSPRVKLDMARIWSVPVSNATYSEGPLGYTEGYVEYTEGPVDENFAEEAAAPVAVTPIETVVKSVKPTSTLEERTSRALFIVVGVMALLVVSGTVLLVLRRNHA